MAKLLCSSLTFELDQIAKAVRSENKDTTFYHYFNLNLPCLNLILSQNSDYF